jgi:hypothetical protein
MRYALLTLAFLGAVLIALAVQFFMPATPTGRTIAFVAWWIALYPVARESWFANVPAWRFWAGLGVAAVAGWTLDTWRTTSEFTAQTNTILGVIALAIATGCLVIATWRARKSRT